MATRRILRISMLGATLVGLAGLAACNPVIYGEIIDGAWVETFSIGGPTQGNAHGRHVITFAPNVDGPGKPSTGDGQLLVGGSVDSTMTLFELNGGAGPVMEFPDLDELQSLVFPIEGVQKAEIGGLVAVPSPVSGDDTPHALVAYKENADPDRARVVYFSVDGFTRVENDSNDDMRNPFVQGAATGSYGTGLAAINIDGGAEYEVMVGSDKGAIIFADMWENHSVYEDNYEAMGGEDNFSGANEHEGYAFTLCAELASANGMASGDFGPGASPVLVAATNTGLHFVGDSNGELNDVEAPVHDCDAGDRAAPGPASSQFGFSMLNHDFDDDGNDDLAVGDPGAEAVFVYMGTGDGLENAPSTTLEPSDANAAEYGFSVGRADLAGTLNTVLLVGAPGTTVEGVANTGAVFVYDVANGFEEIRELVDTEPKSGTRHGIWAGGVFRDDWGRDELVIIGNTEGRVHIALSENDPHP